MTEKNNAMKSRFYFLIIFVFLCACASKKPKILSTTTNAVTTSSDFIPLYEVKLYSRNKNYGLTGDNPVKVGSMSAQKQRRYLSSLAGPNGEVLQFFRRGSCCPYKSENSFMGNALVDIYEVTYDGLKKPLFIYISLYDSEELFIPKGFTKRKI